MVVRPKLSRASEAIIERVRRADPRQGELPFQPVELDRELCEDQDGNLYTVIVWHPVPGVSLVDYTLDDGSPVKFEDDCTFRIERSGIFITRCR